MLVGLTGGIGSGKSTVAELFAQRGVPIVDTDAVAHELTAAGGAAMPAIVAAFGNAVAAADGSLDRVAMRRIAFDDPAARQRLEAILHPMIGAETERRIDAARAPYVIVAVPLLIESRRWVGRVDRVLVVDCPVDEQKRRVAARSGLDAAQIDAIIDAQASRQERLELADDVIDNGGDPSSLDAQVEALHRRYLALSAAA